MPDRDRRSRPNVDRFFGGDASAKRTYQIFRNGERSPRRCTARRSRYHRVRILSRGLSLSRPLHFPLASERYPRRDAFDRGRERNRKSDPAKRNRSKVKAMLREYPPRLPFSPRGEPPSSRRVGSFGFASVSQGRPMRVFEPSAPSTLSCARSCEKSAWRSINGAIAAVQYA